MSNRNDPNASGDSVAFSASQLLGKPALETADMKIWHVRVACIIWQIGP